MTRRVGIAAVAAVLLLTGLASAADALGQGVRPDQATSFVGRWEGAIDVFGTKLNIVVAATDSGSGLKATIDIPQQMATGLSLTNVRFESPKVHFELAAPIGLAVFDGELRNGTIRGTFEQGAAKGTFELVPAGTAKPAAPPEPPPPYKQEEVKIQSGAISLAGTLTLPESPGPYPAVVLITGSGPQNRDEELFGMKPFRLIADALTRRGIAVLRCDDRGAGGSTGNTMQSSSVDFADDAIAEVLYLKGRSEIDKARIGLLGHSEGGLVAPIAASRSSDIAFIVLLSGPAVTGERILYAQSEQLRAAGGTDEAVRKNIEIQKLIFAAVRSGTGWEQVADAIGSQMRASFDAAPPAQRPPADKRDAMIKSYVDAQLALPRTPWFKFFLDYDPAPTLQKVKCPVLAVFGERDLQVPVALNRGPMEQALRSRGNQAYAIEVIPRANHLYQDALTGAFQEYATLKKEFVPELLPLLTSWILKQGPARK